LWCGVTVAVLHDQYMPCVASPEMRCQQSWWTVNMQDSCLVVLSCPSWLCLVDPCLSCNHSMHVQLQTGKWSTTITIMQYSSTAINPATVISVKSTMPRQLGTAVHAEQGCLAFPNCHTEHCIDPKHSTQTKAGRDKPGWNHAVAMCYVPPCCCKVNFDQKTPSSAT
jgi:hypothetical protein